MFSNEAAWRWADLFGYDAQQNLRLAVGMESRIQVGATRTAQKWLHEVGAQRPELYALFVTPEFIVLRLPAAQRPTSLHFVGAQRLALEAQLREVLRGDADFVADASASLDAAIDTQRVPLQRLDPEALQRVVASWLGQCVTAPAGALGRRPAQAWLVESGLYGVLHGGKISTLAPSFPAYAFAG